MDYQGYNPPGFLERKILIELIERISCSTENFLPVLNRKIKAKATIKQQIALLRASMNGLGVIIIQC